jgi:hypothetical protein
MKTLKVIKTIVIYDKDGQIVKEIDVTGLPWKLIWLKAVRALQTSLRGDHWTVVSKPKE